MSDDARPVSPPRPKVLLAVTGRSTGIRWRLEAKRTVIGRASSSDIQLLDESVSRQHAEIELDGERVLLRDLGSQNGATLNGARVSGEAVLQPGDTIGVGTTSFVFEPELDWLVGAGEDVVIAREATETTAELSVSGHEPADEATASLLFDVVAHGLAAGGDVLKAALERVAERFGAERAFVLAATPGGTRPRVLATFGRGPIIVSRTVVERVMIGGAAIYSADAQKDVVLRGGVSLAAGEIRSLLAAPLVVDDRAIGMVHLDRRATDGFAPKDLEALVPVGNVLALVLLASSGIEELKQEARKKHRIERPEIVFRSPAMRAIVEDVRRAAQATSSVLLTGETGTGKEVLARLLHADSPRSQGPFVAVNAGALPATLQESELFGHEKGAFSGADREKAGLFEVANGGTLFLDELGECTPELQVKLLRVLQERAFFRLGGTRPIHVDVRVVAATSRRIEDLLARRELREDLYYRLAVIHLRVPPLRERAEDIPLLARAFARQLSRDVGVVEKTVDQRALDALQGLAWRGNVRELRNVIERLVIATDGPTITLADLPSELLAGSDLARRAVRSGDTLAEAVARVEREMILLQLARTGGVKSAVADALGISRVTLDAKLRAHAIDWPKDRK